MKCKDHSSGEKGIFNLSHFDKDHKDNFKRQQPEANLTIAETDVPLPPPLATTLEPEEEVDATLMPRTFVQYQTAQVKQWMLELNPKVKAREKEKALEIDHHCKDIFYTHHDMPFFDLNQMKSFSILMTILRFMRKRVHVI
jgi:hypothetical protein